MNNGYIAKGGTGFMLLTRYAALLEESFTRARDFVPER